MVREAVEAGVTRMMLAGTTVEDCPWYLETIAGYAGILYTSIGIHPEAVGEYRKSEVLPRMREWCKCPGVVAVGEVGLDYHYDATTPADQAACFVDMMALAVETSLPLIIHCREAFADCFRLVKENMPAGHPIQLHSFADGPAELEQWLTLNTYFSYNGMCTFKKAENIRETLRMVPDERLLLETDAPYLTPTPFRGKPNSSKFIPLIAQRIAEERQTTIKAIADLTTANACRFFRL